MQIMRTLILALFFLLTAAIGTAISAQSESGGAKITPPTASASNDLSDCAQMLDQSIAEARALKDKVAALEQLVSLDDQIIKKKDDAIADQAKLIDIYEKRKGTRISFLFGLIKFSKN